MDDFTPQDTGDGMDFGEMLRRLMGAPVIDPAEKRRQQIEGLVLCGVRTEDAEALILLTDEGHGKAATEAADAATGDDTPVTLTTTREVLARVHGLLGYAVVQHLNMLLQAASQSQRMGVPIDALLDTSEVTTTVTNFRRGLEVLNLALGESSVGEVSVPDDASALTE